MYLCCTYGHNVQRKAITAAIEPAEAVGAGHSIVDIIAITDVEARSRAIAPNGVLHETREDFGEALIELAGVDLGRDLADDADTALGAVTRRAIGVLGIEAAQNTGSVEKIVHQPIDRNHPRSDLGPARPMLACTKQQIGER